MSPSCLLVLSIPYLLYPSLQCCLPKKVGVKIHIHGALLPPWLGFLVAFVVAHSGVVAAVLAVAPDGSGEQNLKSIFPKL